VWLGLLALVLGLIAAAILLAPWKLEFALDARELHQTLYEQAREERSQGTLGWLVAAGYVCLALHEKNAEKIRFMSRLSATLSLLMVLQTLAWLTALLLD
jgi:hypothetical protein